jgi:ssDNA-binding Zn-finger/Zn-ribbon topoisomerase 1
MKKAKIKINDSGIPEEIDTPKVGKLTKTICPHCKAELTYRAVKKVRRKKYTMCFHERLLAKYLLKRGWYTLPNKIVKRDEIETGAYCDQCGGKLIS